MHGLAADLVDEFCFLRDNCVQVELVALIFSLGAASMTSEIATNESDSSAKEWNEMVYQIGVSTLARLINYDFRFCPRIGIVIDFVIIAFACRQVTVMATHDVDVEEVLGWLKGRGVDRPAARPPNRNIRQRRLWGFWWAVPSTPTAVALIHHGE